LGIEAKALPTPADFRACPIWRYDQDDELYHPVVAGKDLPESERDVSIYARFQTPAGFEFDGYVVGIERVFSIGLFAGDQVFQCNKNLKDLSLEQVRRFLAATGRIGSSETFFPLRYTTSINGSSYRDFSGQFHLTA
jgi:hypothetical protein